MKLQKPIITIFSLSVLALVLTACQPTTVEEKPRYEESNIPPKGQPVCFYEDGSCCPVVDDGEEGICQAIQVSCEQGKEPVIKGCNEKCEAVFECAPNKLNESEKEATNQINNNNNLTFSSNLHSFTYQYPQDWNLSKKGGLLTGGISSPDGRTVIDIEEARDLTGMSPKEALEKKYKKYFDAQMVSEVQSLIIRNDPAYKGILKTVTSQSVEMDKKIPRYEIIMIAHQNKIYSIRYIEYDREPAFWQHHQILEKILSTFNLTP